MIEEYLCAAEDFDVCYLNVFLVSLLLHVGMAEILLNYWQCAIYVVSGLNSLSLS